MVRGPRSAADVWEDYARIARWPTWSPQITSVTASAERIAAGELQDPVVRCGPLRIPFTVLGVDESARTWTWRAAGMTLDHGVLELPGGCVTTLRAPAPYRPVAWPALWRLTHRQQPRDRLHR
jgi:hypothetical protein